MSIDMLSALGGSAQAGQARPQGAFGSGSPDAGVGFAAVMDAQMTQEAGAEEAGLAAAVLAAVPDGEAAMAAEAIVPPALAPVEAEASKEEGAPEEAIATPAPKRRSRADEGTAASDMVFVPVAAPVIAGAADVSAAGTSSTQGGSVMPVIGTAQGLTGESEAPEANSAAPASLAPDAADAGQARPGEATALLEMLKAQGTMPARPVEAGQLAAANAKANDRNAAQTSSLAIAAAQAADGAAQAEAVPQVAGAVVALKGEKAALRAPDAAVVGGAAVEGDAAEALAPAPVPASSPPAKNAHNPAADAGARAMAVADKAAAPATARDRRLSSAEQSVGAAEEGSAAGSGAMASIPSPAGAAVPTGAATASYTPVSALSSPSGAVGAALDQQVIDLGVSGQWIDDIARQIATVASNPGQGSFRIASEQLGGVQVDIRPGAHGSDIRMTVDSEAAHLALTKDQGRLLEDAQLSAVRLGDVRIDRVSAPAESQRGNGDAGRQDAPSQQQAQSGAQSSTGQNGGQQGQQQGRPDLAGMDMGNNGGNAKTPFTRTVIRDAVAADAMAAARNGSSDGARYA